MAGNVVVPYFISTSSQMSPILLQRDANHGDTPA